MTDAPTDAERYRRDIDAVVCRYRDQLDAAAMVPALVRAARELSAAARAERDCQDHLVVDPRDGSCGLAGDIDDAQEYLTGDASDAADLEEYR